MTTACPVSANTTIAQSAGGGGLLGIGDAYHPLWVPRLPGHVTKGQMLDVAQRQIAHLMDIPHDWDDDGGLPVTSDAAKLALMMLRTLIVADNLATPQISPQGNGGLDVEWLVSRKHLSLSVAADGHVVLWATNPDGTEEFSFDSADPAADGTALVAAIDSARRFLASMSQGIRSRITI